MSKDFKFVCDFCGKQGKAKWNGETWLQPKNWRMLWDNNEANVIDGTDMCEDCIPLRTKDAERTPNDQP